MYMNGDSFQGEFQDDRPHGKGSYSTPSYVFFHYKPISFVS